MSVKSLFKRIVSAVATALTAVLSIGQTQMQTGVRHPEWSRNAVIYEVNVRQYTADGTFNSLKKELPRLHDLGVDILWLMPVHPISKVNRKGVLGSYYAASDYKAVNPEFGSLSDFISLVDEAHRLGMKVILDWVPNHTGCDHRWVKEHPEYYARNEKGQMYGPYDWTDVYKLDYTREDTRAAMRDAMAYWLRYCGVDGFRCDVAGQVPTDFWNETRPYLEEAAGKPIFMLAEDSQPELTEHAFDMDYNWPMKDLFSAVANSAGQYTVGDNRVLEPKNARDIIALVKEQNETFPVDSYLMNMTTNHDLNSWEGTEFRRLGKFAAPFAILTYVLPGMPLIYTGQETGLDRAFEFFSKDEPPVWEPRNDYFDFYRRLNALKHERPELRAGAEGGNIMTVSTGGSPDILAFKRELDGQGIFFAANFGSKTEAFAPCKCLDGLIEVTDVFTGAPVVTLPAALAPGQYILFTYKVR